MLTDAAARKIIRTLAAAGKIVFLPHAQAELLVDKMTTFDAHRVLHGGSVAFDATYRGNARYRVTGSAMIVVVELHDDLLVVTGFAR